MVVLDFLLGGDINWMVESPKLDAIQFPSVDIANEYTNGGLNIWAAEGSSASNGKRNA